MNALPSGTQTRSDQATPTRWQPRQVLLLFLLAHIVVWTLLPALMHTGLPIDLVEGYAIGREWVVGYHKHPAGPWWLIEAARSITGAVGWPAYLISASLVALTYWLAFLLGRDMLGERRAVAGALLLSGVMYFSWVVPEYNHNVAPMPVWLAFILALWRARERGSLIWWIAVGLFAALGLYAKLATILLPALATVYMLVDVKLRASLRTAGPWLALVAFVIASLPIMHWLYASEFLALDYAAERSRGRAAGGVALFLGKQVASAAGLYVLLAVALWQRPSSAGTSPEAAPSIAPDARRFLLYFLLAPILALAALAAVSGVGLKGSWATPMLSLAGLAAVALAGSRFDATAADRILCGAVALLAAVPIAYAVSLRQPSTKLLTPQRTNWPQAVVAQEMQRLWREATGKPLRIVAGDLWTAGMVAAHASDKPSILVDGSLRYSPWIDRARLQREGFMAVWWRTREDPPDDLRPWIGTRIDGQHVFHMRGSDRKQTAIVLYTIVKPGALTEGGGPPAR
ncbi:MAG: glycosyltransferase family 39 protein [Hyphomicrobiaceae bacterium]